MDGMSEKIEKNDSAAKTPDSKPAKKNKVKFSARAAKYGREFKAEFKKIVWPSKKTVVRNTSVVLAAIVAMGAIIAAFDWCLGQLLGLIVH